MPSNTINPAIVTGAVMADTDAKIAQITKNKADPAASTFRGLLYPIGFRGRKFQGALRYERTGDDKDRVVIDPRVEFGFAPNWQGKIPVPFYLGSADKTDSGNIGLEAFYNFNTEGIVLPAFALSTRADLPTGRDSAGIDTRVKAIVTKSITKTGFDRIHLNMVWKHNAGARHEQREDLYRAMLG